MKEIEIINSFKSKASVEAFDGVFFWIVKKNKIFRCSTLNNITLTHPVISVPNKYARHSYDLVNRLLRQGIHNLILYSEGCVIIVKGKLLIYRNDSLIRVINIPRGSRPLRDGITILENNLFFGDYWPNNEKRDANVYRLNLISFELEIILSLKVRHIHIVTASIKRDELIIGTGDKDDECSMLLFNYITREKFYIGQGSQKFRAVSVIQYEENIIWGMDAPNEQNYIYSFNRDEINVKQYNRIKGPAYFSAVNKNGYLFIATTIEDKKEHRSILYCSRDFGKNWNELCEYKKDIFHEKLFGYGVIEFINGQEKLSGIHCNLINLHEKK